MADFISREFPELITVAGTEAQEDKIDLRGLLRCAFAPGGAGTLEEAALDTVGPAQAPGVDSDPLGELVLHGTLRLEGRDEVAIEALELVAVLIEEDDALGGETVLQGIATGGRAASFGARPCAAERVAAIGFDLQRLVMARFRCRARTRGIARIRNDDAVGLGGARRAKGGAGVGSLVIGYVDRRRDTMAFAPEPQHFGFRIDALLYPPVFLVADHVQAAVVGEAKRHRPFIRDLVPYGAQLGKAQVCA